MMANVQEIPELDPNMFVVKRGKFWVILVIFIFISKYVLLTGHRSLKTENQSQLGYSRKNKQTGGWGYGIPWGIEEMPYKISRD